MLIHAAVLYKSSDVAIFEMRATICLHEINGFDGTGCVGCSTAPRNTLLILFIFAIFRGFQSYCLLDHVVLRCAFAESIKIEIKDTCARVARACKYRDKTPPQATPTWKTWAGVRVPSPNLIFYLGNLTLLYNSCWLKAPHDNWLLIRPFGAKNLNFAEFIICSNFSILAQLKLERNF